MNVRLIALVGAREGIIRSQVKKEVESRIMKPIAIKFTQPEASTSGAKRAFRPQHAITRPITNHIMIKMYIGTHRYGSVIGK